MKTFLLLVLSLSASALFSQDFKVIGYLATWNFDSHTSLIEWERLTHVNLAFANPDAGGNLTTEGVNIDPVVAAAHDHGVKVFISLAGGYLAPQWENAWNYWMQPQRLNDYIGKILQYVETHDLDGVDVDLEWQYVNELYSPFVLALKNALAAQGLPMTAALPGSYRYPQITPQALAAFDWINLMVYDLTGPWDPSNPGQHSPYAWALQCLQYWENQGLPGARQTLGVPFYGYNFGVSPVDGVPFSEIVALNTANAYVDQVGQLFYNGIPTIEAKTRLALQETSGIMIWELGQDAYDPLADYSLLRVIDRTVHPTSATGDPTAPGIRLFPNPASGWIAIDGLPLTRVFAQIFDFQGKLRWQGYSDDQARIDLTGLPEGLFALHLQGEGWTQVRSFVKI